MNDKTIATSKHTTNTLKNDLVIVYLVKGNLRS
jgi:hypothetical protein